MTHIVALMGLAGSGKSTAADYLCMNYGFNRVKFADPMKDMLRVIGLTDEELEGEFKNEPCSLLMGRTPRHAMQTLGTEWGRELIHPELWTRLWIERACQFRLVVADDLRFPNEADIVRKNGGKIVKIVRPNLERIQGNHTSESSMESIEADIVVDNSGSIRDLCKAVYANAF